MKSEPLQCHSIARALTLQWRQIGVETYGFTGFSTVCSTVCLAYHQRKHQRSAWGEFIGHRWRWPMDSPHKGPVMWITYPCLHHEASPCPGTCLHPIYNSGSIWVVYEVWEKYCVCQDLWNGNVWSWVSPLSLSILWSSLWGAFFNFNTLNHGITDYNSSLFFNSSRNLEKNFFVVRPQTNLQMVQNIAMF